jgi:hypothetical protein
VLVNAGVAGTQALSGRLDLTYATNHIGPFLPTIPPAGGRRAPRAGS